jgi:hypothetical protein
VVVVDSTEKSGEPIDTFKLNLANNKMIIHQESPINLDQLLLSQQSKQSIHLTNKVNHGYGVQNELIEIMDYGERVATVTENERENSF